MITGEIKNKIDAIWSTFWESAGITNPMDVLSQMTYLFFMKMLDDAQIKKEATAHAFGDRLTSVADYIRSLHIVITKPFNTVYRMNDTPPAMAAEG